MDDLEIHRVFIIESPSENPICLIALVNKYCWCVCITYDKATALDQVQGMKSFVEDRWISKFSSQIEESNMLEHDPYFRDAIHVPFYAGRRLAISLDAYAEAMSQQFKPFTSWPVIGSMPDLKVVTIVGDKQSCWPKSEESIYIFNGLLGYSDTWDDHVVYVLNSMDQWIDCIYNQSDLQENHVDLIHKTLNTAVLPESSELESVKFTGELADFLMRVLRYVCYMNRVLDGSCNCKWRNAVMKTGQYLN